MCLYDHNVDEMLLQYQSERMHSQKAKMTNERIEGALRQMKIKLLASEKALTLVRDYEVRLVEWDNVL